MTLSHLFTVWRGDARIDTLIRPPRSVFVGFDWTRTDKLRPTGDAQREDMVASRLSPDEWVR